MKKHKFSYKARLKEYARQLRNNPTLAEKMLWNTLKRKQLKITILTDRSQLVKYIAFIE